jgi:hypothetical protein
MMRDNQTNRQREKEKEMHVLDMVSSVHKQPNKEKREEKQ